MKVMCVKNLLGNCLLTGEQANKIPVINIIYTVIDESKFIGRKYYILKEFGQDEAWDADAFEPLDDYLEQFTESLTKELIEVKQLELV